MNNTLFVYPQSTENGQLAGEFLVEDIKTPAGTPVKLFSYLVVNDYRMSSYNQDVVIDDDGKTAYCDVCKTNKVLEGFDTTLLFWGDRLNPSEYGQICKDCQDKRNQAEEDFELDEGVEYN